LETSSLQPLTVSDAAHAGPPRAEVAFARLFC
jgi:hypothetical protein